jgi:hypothetical protein
MVLEVLIPLGLSQIQVLSEGLRFPKIDFGSDGSAGRVTMAAGPGLTILYEKSGLE